MAKAGATITFNDINQELVDKGIAAYEAEVGSNDILVNNAGIIKRIPMHEMTAAEFRQVIDIDLNDPFIVPKAVIPSMMKKRQVRLSTSAQ